MWKVKIYRTDSHTPVEYDHVKYSWWEGNSRYVISQYIEPTKPEHRYITYPISLISHVVEEKK